MLVQSSVLSIFPCFRRVVHLYLFIYTFISPSAFKSCITTLEMGRESSVSDGTSISQSSTMHSKYASTAALPVKQYVNTALGSAYLWLSYTLGCFSSNGLQWKRMDIL